MKQCKKCLGEFELNNFYTGNAICKKCYKEKVRLHREEKRDYYIEYDKNRANQPHRVKAREDYAKTEKGIIAGNKAKKNWCEHNLIKRSASFMVNNAVRDGKIIKPTKCESCANQHVRLEGHHDDYSKPLEVRWLCPRCHTAWHKENGEGLNG